MVRSFFIQDDNWRNLVEQLGAQRNDEVVKVADHSSQDNMVRGKDVAVHGLVGYIHYVDLALAHITVVHHVQIKIRCHIHFGVGEV